MDEEIYIHNDEYSGELLEGLNSLREQNQLCDVIINVGGREFPAHKAVLAAKSSYFTTMFTSGFQESIQREIKIDGNPEAFDMLLEFAYTGKVNVTKLKSHMFDVFELSLYTDFHEFCLLCSQILKKLFELKEEGITVDEVCKVMFLANKHDEVGGDDDFWDLACAARSFLMANLEVLKDTEVFLENATETFLLKEFLCNEDLATENEEKQVSASQTKVSPGLSRILFYLIGSFPLCLHSLFCIIYKYCL